MSSTTPTHVRSDKEAVRNLQDGPYIAHVLVQMFKLGIALFTKRWPELG